LTGTRTRAIALVLALSVAGTGLACSDGADGGDGEADPSRAAGTTAVLEVLADDVIIPSYEALAGALEQLEADVEALCAAPSAEALAVARASWRATAASWRDTRASGVGPAMDRRLAASIGFLARPAAVDELLSGSDPVDPAGLEAASAAVKGLSALEIGLFGAGSEALADPGDPRRCTYLSSVSGLASDRAAAVLADWTDGYRDTFVAGMDGDPQSSVDAIVNEVIFRVTEADDQGLRALVEADALDELPANRTDGPAAFQIAELERTLAGSTALLGDDVDDGRLLALVGARSADTAARLDEAATTATEAMGALPDSAADAFTRHPDELAEAQAAVSALKVLLATEVASELGVTIGFSDADGDS
jgi:predicted lipoprotein